MLEVPKSEVAPFLLYFLGTDHRKPNVLRKVTQKNTVCSLQKTLLSKDNKRFEEG